MVLNESVGPTLTKKDIAKMHAEKNTTIYKVNVEIQGDVYVTYTASIDADLFLDFTKDYGELDEISEYYAEYLYERIERQKVIDADWPYYTMSVGHIHYELLAHIIAWDFARIPNAGRIDLNVDESRLSVIGFMSVLGFSGIEEFDWGK